MQKTRCVFQPNLGASFYFISKN